MTTHTSRDSTATPLRTKWHTNSYLTEDHRTDNRKYASTDSGIRATRETDSFYGSGTRHQSTEERQSTRPGRHPNGADQAVWTQGTRLATSFDQLLYRDKGNSEARKGPIRCEELPTDLPALPTYKLFERLILNRIAEHVDAKLIPEQAGFRPGKSCTSQLLNLTEHIEDCYEKRLISGVVLVDLSATYDTVNHRRLLSKVLEMTGDVHLTDMIRTMLESRRLFVVLNGKKSN